MALNIADAADAVDHGSGASIDDLDPFTWMAWVNMNSFTNGRAFFHKKLNTKYCILSNTGGNVEFVVARATTNTQLITNDTPLSTGTWQLVAFVFDSGGGAGEIGHVYVGNLTTPATESTYATETDGAGAVTTDADSGMFVGNKAGSGGNRSLQGHVACFTYVAEALTLKQVTDWQFRPRMLTNAKIFSHYGGTDTGNQPDLSGNGNDGTPAGTTVSDHVPLGPLFGFDIATALVAGAAPAGNAPTGHILGPLYGPLGGPIAV